MKILFFILCIVFVLFHRVNSISINQSPLIISRSTHSKINTNHFQSSHLKTSLEKDINRIINGVKGLFHMWNRINDIKKRKKEKGLYSISYTEYKLLDTFNEDVGKLLRILITIPLSVELFFYSYILFPVMSMNKNPWSWRAFPSSFDYPDEKHKRNHIIQKRRIQLLINSISWLKSNSIDDMNDEFQRGMRQDEIQLLEKAVQEKSIEKSLKVLEPLYMTDNRETKSLVKQNKKVKANIDNLASWSTIKDMCRAIGVDGMPNIFFLRRLNRGEIIKYTDKIRDEDEFICHNSVKTLKEEELEEICRNRFIPIYGKSESQLRRSVERWLDLTDSCYIYADTDSDNDRYIENEQNKRLVLMGLNLYEDFKAHPFAATYRTLISGRPV